MIWWCWCAYLILSSFWMNSWVSFIYFLLLRTDPADLDNKTYKNKCCWSSCLWYQPVADAVEKLCLLTVVNMLLQCRLLLLAAWVFPNFLSMKLCVLDFHHDLSILLVMNSFEFLGKLVWFGKLIVLCCYPANVGLTPR
jgi:hypothetical protein